MTDLLNLGPLYVSDFLAVDEEPRAQPVELRLVMDDDGLVHLAEQPPAQFMWGRYWYRSGTNATMTFELADLAMEAARLVGLGRGDVWVDIASNDGTLLSHLPHDVVTIGVDPCEFAHDADPYANEVIAEPFTANIADWIVGHHGHAKVVTCVAMFYDLMDPTDFLAGVHHLLERDGLFVIQVSYTPLMIEQLAFDNICHEHARYYTLQTLADTLWAAGFKVVDAQLNDTNGGSMRVFARRLDADPKTFAAQPYRDVATMRVRSLLDHELVNGYNTAEPWLRFAARLEHLKLEVGSYLRLARARGERIWGYGASTKGNTLLQYFELDRDLIEGIAERQPAKFGRRTIGTNIPIHDEATMRVAEPDYLLMLPWHFVAEFVTRERDYLDAGGRFIVPCPRFEVIGDGRPQVADGARPA